MRVNSKRRTPKSSRGVYLDNEVAAATGTTAKDLTGKRNVKQEVVWNLELVAREFPHLHSF